MPLSFRRVVASHSCRKRLVGGHYTFLTSGFIIAFMVLVMFLRSINLLTAFERRTTLCKQQPQSSPFSALPCINKSLRRIVFTFVRPHLSYQAAVDGRMEGDGQWVVQILMSNMFTRSELYGTDDLSQVNPTGRTRLRKKKRLILCITLPHGTKHRTHQLHLSLTHSQSQLLILSAVCITLRDERLLFDHFLPRMH